MSETTSMANPPDAPAARALPHEATTATSSRTGPGHAGRIRHLMRRMPPHAAYLLLGCLPPLITFLVVVILGSLGLGTIILWVGLPVLTLTALCARGGAGVERSMARRATGIACPAPPYRHPAAGAPLIQRLVLPLTDPQVWLDMAWALFGWLVALVGAMVTLGWTLAALAPFTAWQEARNVVRGVPGLHNLTTLLMNITHCDSVAQGTLMGTLAGMAFLVTLPGMLALMAQGRALLTRTVLSNGMLARENRTLRTSRDAGRVAETTRLRQLERDIHDGPQQRLVRLTMDLARTKQVLGRDPEHAQEMLDAAMLSTQETLAELRNLSRGIAPPVLVDRGLEAALTELAALSGVPVTLHAELPPELPDHVATAAYFAASEALTNVNKHSLATHVQMICGVQDHWLFLTVTDDGIGGARLDKGHGLAGLAERLRAVDGQLDLDSPEGGGTRVEAVILCRS